MEKEGSWSDTDASTLILSNSSTPLKKKTKRTSLKERKLKPKTGLVHPTENVFATYQVYKEKPHRSVFEIIPPGHQNNKLVESIKAGGGIVVTDSSSFHNGKNFVIKILDLDYVRKNIYRDKIQDMLIPNDCFSSNFIWAQIFCEMDEEKCNLNLYRISPSAYEPYDANEIFAGRKSWGDLKLKALEDIPSQIRMKDAALQMFPEILMHPPRTRRIYTRQESQILLDKVCSLQGHSKILSIQLYEDISRHHMTNRTGASLREHFRKTILPHVLANDGYYVVSAKDYDRFQEVQAEKQAKNKEKGEIEAGEEIMFVESMETSDSP